MEVRLQAGREGVTIGGAPMGKPELSHRGHPGCGKISPVAEPNRVETLERPLAKGEPRFLNRELSWLEFNARVLHEAEDPDNPLLERVKFAAIFAGNLDEFFQVRIAGLRQQVEAGAVTRAPDGRTPAEQLAASRDRVLELVADQSANFLELRAALDAEGISIVDY